MKSAVVTVSDRSARGEREDLSGKVLQERLRATGAEVAAYRVIPDEQALISAVLVELSDELSVDLILTTGGTGPAPRDVTPEATQAVLDREMPGLAELLRSEGRRHTPFAVLSRGRAGIRGRTLVVNLPGSPKAVEESWEMLAPLLPVVVALVRGEAAGDGICHPA
jgi:molybdenum cofactor synthesis domain-containing protein